MYTLILVAMVMTAMLKGKNTYFLNLPEGQRSRFFPSYYSTIAPRYRDELNKRSESAMSASLAAKQIIDAVEWRTSGKIYVGTMAWIFRWIWPFLSTSRQDKINGDLLHVELLAESPLEADGWTQEMIGHEADLRKR